jgi:hypothetical protein
VQAGEVDARLRALIEGVPTADGGRQLAAGRLFADFAHPAEFAIHVQHEMQGHVVAAKPLPFGDGKGNREQAPAGADGPGKPGQAVAGQREVERDVNARGILRLRVPDDLVGAETAEDVRVGGTVPYGTTSPAPMLPC